MSRGKTTLSVVVLAGAVAWSLAAQAAVVIDIVTVGNPGNANDTHGDGYGGVDYVYSIGTFEVTAGQYTEFLSAVAAEDTYGVYNTDMWTSSYGCKIEWSGESGSYTYSVVTDWTDRMGAAFFWGENIYPKDHLIRPAVRL